MCNLLSDTFSVAQRKKSLTPIELVNVPTTTNVFPRADLTNWLEHKIFQANNTRFPEVQLAMNHNASGIAHIPKEQVL